ncbi:IS3 family transposase [Wolbachia endosymbiont (group A) of Melieria omissa]|uniref:IS3 family transposase n=2 Tax=unclassified Wolbachia TaxID=2640676 RepID=UPI003CCB42D1
MFFYIVTAIKYRNYVGFSASGYYKWTTRKISSRESANKELLEAIQKIYQVSKCRYGAPKIHAELKALGKSCNLKTVQSIMQKNDIRAILRRKFKIKKQQTDNRAVAPNILDQNFIAFLIIVRTGHRKAESTARRKDSNRGMFFLALFFIANQ